MSAMARRVFIALAVPLAAQALLPIRAALAQMPPPPAISRAPGDGVHVEGYVGMEYVTLDRNTFEQFEVRGISRQPYVLKVADVHVTGLGRFEAGVNGAATSLLALGGFVNEKDTSATDLGEAERYAALLGYAIGKHITLRGEGTFAHMVTYGAPSFHRTGDIALTTYYAPQDGPLQRLTPGAAVPGNTDWYSLAVTARVDGNPVGLEWLKDIILGYRLVRVSTLSSYLVSPGAQVDSFAQGLVQDTLSCHSLYAMSNFDNAVFNDLHVVGNVHGFAGYASVSSSFVDTAGGFCFGEGGTLALEYVQPHWSLVVGYNYDEFVAVPVAGGNTLSSNVPYSDPSTGRVMNARAGSTWSVSGPADSFRVIGPFARLSVAY